MVSKKEFEMKDYAMFSKEGNEAVAALVNVARAAELTWPETYQLMQRLAKNEKFGEVMDTMVREIIFDTLGYKTAFYI